MAEEKNKGGRPMKFKSAKELQKKIDEYFESCFEEVWEREYDSEMKPIGWKPILDRHGNVVKQQVEPFTITGLALHLELDRKALIEYAEKEEFSNTIKQAKLKIEQFTEKQLFDKSARNMTGIIFNLKNNYGWQDKSEVDSNIANKDGKPFETKSAVSALSLEELRALAQSKPSSA